MSSKISIKIPGHNSLTPTLFNDLLKVVGSARKLSDAKRVRSRLPAKYHIAIVSTGLSYLGYLGALRKVKRNYKPTPLGKKIGISLKQGKLEEADATWAELLKRHRMYNLFLEYFERNNQSGTIEDFGSYLKEKAHQRWSDPFLKNRVIRLCELYADKGLIRYENQKIYPKEETPQSQNILLKKTTALDVIQPPETIPLRLQPTQVQQNTSNVQPSQTPEMTPKLSLSASSGPVKIEMRIEITDRANPQVVAMILSFLKDMTNIEVKKGE